MKDIKWLHLSDLHIGSKENKWLDPMLRKRIVDALQSVGKLNFIIVTGDVIDKGQYDNNEIHNQAVDFFKEIRELCDTIIFAAGNHDYMRDKLRANILKEWRKLSQEEKRREEEMYASRLKADFNKYISFCNSISEGKIGESSLSYVDKRVPGINIVVLNTSIFTGQPMIDTEGNIIKNNDIVQVDDEQKLWIAQMDFPSTNNVENEYPTIVIGHHTIQMFEESARKNIISFMRNLPSKYYFCGHIHRIEDSKIGDIEQIACSGLFSDDYNTPSFAIHTLKRSANEHIESDFFKFEKGEWLRRDKKEDYEILYQETESRRTKDIYTVKQSEVSDGAISLPYNNGVFNIYNSVVDTPYMITPHCHLNIDEITYVTKGSVYFYDDGKCYLISERNASLISKGHMHAFLPLEYPCEYITMSAETSRDNEYESAWTNDLDDIERLDKEISNSTHYIEGEKYIKLVEYLKSTVMEVRWKTISVLKKYLALETDDSTYIQSLVDKLVIDTLKSEKVDKKLFGINLACEFQTKISLSTICDLLSDDQEYMYAWNCAYYLLKLEKDIDSEKIKECYNKVRNRFTSLLGTNYHNSYYECIIISLIQLILNQDGTLLKDVYSNMTIYEDSELIPAEDVMIHFFLWFTLINKCDGINFAKALSSIPQRTGVANEPLLRVLLNRENTAEKYKVLKLCQQNGELIEVIRAFFEAFENKKEKEKEESPVKENIKSYLRIIVSEKCNLTCPYCHHEGRINSLVGNYISNNPNFNLEEILSFAKKCGFKKIKISGGEPLLFPNILEICNKYQHDFDDIGFTTNGTKIMKLIPEFENIGNSKLTFNVTLNSCDAKKYYHITGNELLGDVQSGLKYLVDHKYRVKINSVITTYNFDDIETLIAYAARLKIDIKLLDLFPISDNANDFGHVSLAEIKNKLIELYSVKDEDFYLLNDYLCINAMGIRIMIPKRIYSSNCIYNCPMYPCAEGLFGIRVYEDYSCAYCLKGKVYRGGIENFQENIIQIRSELDRLRFSF